MTRVTWDYDEVYNIKFTSYTEKKGKINTTHINTISSFDIETSSGYLTENGVVKPFSHKEWENVYFSTLKKRPDDYVNHVSAMYVWQFAVENGNDTVVFMGRTWDDYADFMAKYADAVTDYLVFKGGAPDSVYKSWVMSCKTWKKPTIHIYVHNLAFEMQFLRNVIPIKNVFARQKRKPMKFDYDNGDVIFKFHDTLCLTQKSLANWAKDAGLSVQKLVGDLDYLVIRNSHTPLTAQEIDYCVNDVDIIVEGMKQYRAKYSNKLSNIPMTQTGEVRLVCQREIAAKNPTWANMCYQIDHGYSWKFFNRLLQCFTGGWTHANEKYSGHLQGTVSDPIVCWDFTSSYPSVMTTTTFPISAFYEVDEQRLHYLETLDKEIPPYRFIVMATLHDVDSKLWNTFFSASKAIDLAEDSIIDNGKIVSTDRMTVVVTDYDWDILHKAYSIGSEDIIEVYEAEADYLPYEFIDVILRYYEDKTKLKGIDSAKSAYVAAKQFINSLYGVAVTKILTKIVKYENGEWKTREPEESDYDETMKIPSSAKKMQNQINKKFTTYQIGCFIPAAARHRLWDAILEFDSKIVYCDTDSVKGHFDGNDIKWFDTYNNGIGHKQLLVAQHYNFSVDRFSPKNKAGEACQLGVFDREHDCVEFKALRSKVYACKAWDKKASNWAIETTIAGLPKRSGVKLVKDVDDLKDNLFWTPQQSEKLCTHYLDEQQTATWIDEQGNSETRKDKYGIMLEPIGFDLSLTEEYTRLLEILSGYTDNDYFDTPEIIRNFYE